MRVDYFEAVVWSKDMRDAGVYCLTCLPHGVDPEGPEVSPIFAVDEWDYPGPTCEVCGKIHDYMSVLPQDYYDGLAPSEPAEDDILITLYGAGPLGSGPYTASCEGQVIAQHPYRETLERLVWNWCLIQGYYPDIWTVSDHGNYERVSEAFYAQFKEPA